MKRKFAAGVVACFVFGLSAPKAQEVKHVTVAGRAVAVWKPVGPVPATGHPLVLFSHGFGGCNTQTTFLMEALAKAGYFVLAPNHQDARCGSARQAGSGMQKPEAPFRDVEKWSDATYRDRRDDMEAVLDAVLAEKTFAIVHLDPNRVGMVGHSLGGYTVLGLAGGWLSWKDPRVKAGAGVVAALFAFYREGKLGHDGCAGDVSGRDARYR